MIYMISHFLGTTLIYLILKDVNIVYIVILKDRRDVLIQYVYSIYSARVLYI